LFFLSFTKFDNRREEQVLPCQGVRGVIPVGKGRRWEKYVRG
jgi:hypothetical protein